MNVVILVAGQGTRFISEEPKCLSAIDNKSVLTRVIDQVNKYLPDSKVKVIVGYKEKNIRDHLVGYDIEFIKNNKYKIDKNIWSVISALNNSKMDTLIIEGDCVYEDKTFKEISKSLGKKSTIFLGGKADKERNNGVVKIKQGLFDDFKIGPKNGQKLTNYYDMVGAMLISSTDTKKYLKSAKELIKSSLNFYYFEPMFNKKDFKLHCKRLSGKRYTFNTPEEYKEVVSSLIPINFFPVNDLKHIEGFSEKRANWLKDKIIKEDVWTKPICIDPEGLVMDGQHRMEVSKKIGLKKVPVIVFDYEEVEIWSLRKNHKVSIKSIKSRVEKGNIYPYKTVKHRFPIGVLRCHIPLKKLYED